MKKYPDDFNEWILKNFKTDFKCKTPAQLRDTEPTAMNANVYKKFNPVNLKTSTPNKFKLVETIKEEIKSEMIEKYKNKILLTHPTVEVYYDGKKFIIISVKFWYK